MSHEFIPDSLQHGLTVPIPINHHADKDPTNPSNYRGITLLSNVGKLLVKVILQRLHDRSNIDSSLSPGTSGWFQTCLHTAMVFQEAIQHIRESGKKAYVALLDVRKAFDMVWHEGLAFSISSSKWELRIMPGIYSENGTLHHPAQCCGMAGVPDPSASTKESNREPYYRLYYIASISMTY